MQRNYKIKNYTLMELLLSGSILVLLLSFLITFFHKGSKLCSNFSENAYSNQQILTIKNKWRKFVHKSDIDTISRDKEGKVFTCKKGLEIVVDGQYIHFKDMDQTSSYRLSKNMSAKFDIDRGSGVPLAVMNIILTPRMSGDKEEVIRIVACPGVKRKDEKKK